jgi:hypothetical protein
VSKEKLVIRVLLAQTDQLAQRALKDLQDQQANKDLRDLRVPQVLKEQLDQQVRKALLVPRDLQDHKVRLDHKAPQVRLAQQAHKELKAFKVFKVRLVLRDQQDLLGQLGLRVLKDLQGHRVRQGLTLLSLVQQVPLVLQDQRERLVRQDHKVFKVSRVLKDLLVRLVLKGL